jgi:hypothetical protein
MIRRPPKRIGGAIGAEFDALWGAVEGAQVLNSPDVVVEQTTRGTRVKRKGPASPEEFEARAEYGFEIGHWGGTNFTPTVYDGNLDYVQVFDGAGLIKHPPNFLNRVLTGYPAGSECYAVGVTQEGIPFYSEKTIVHRLAGPKELIFLDDSNVPAFSGVPFYNGAGGATQYPVELGSTVKIVVEPFDDDFYPRDLRYEIRGPYVAGNEGPPAFYVTEPELDLGVFSVSKRGVYTVKIKTADNVGDLRRSFTLWGDRKITIIRHPAGGTFPPGQAILDVECKTTDSPAFVVFRWHWYPFDASQTPSGPVKTDFVYQPADDAGQTIFQFFQLPNTPQFSGGGVCVCKIYSSGAGWGLDDIYESTNPVTITFS